MRETVATPSRQVAGVEWDHYCPSDGMHAVAVWETY